MFPVAFSGRICCFRCFAGARARRLSGYPDVCAITDAPLLCGAGLDGAGRAGPDGLHHDLDIGKRSYTSFTSTTSLTLFGLRGYVFYGCISTRFLYLVDRSWYLVVPIVGNFFFYAANPTSSTLKPAHPVQEQQHILGRQIHKISSLI